MRLDDRRHDLDEDDPPGYPGGWPVLPIHDPDADVEEDDESPDDERRSVLITGAAGNIGVKLREAW